MADSKKRIVFRTGVHLQMNTGIPHKKDTRENTEIDKGIPHEEDT